MATNCKKQAKEGVADATYFERRLDTIETRIDDLCGLVGQLLDALDAR